ncbi:MerR family transcriptional regulator [Streptomyces sp. NPDC094034]|uniref:MerR family transcriptional regulator n=1 Tax=Streptomyces sp. NPDC094034 TaxID=3155309 RepID=UPI00331D53BD
MRIGELAGRTGVSRRALRYYEEQGLLRPERGPSGYREYAETDVADVRRIRTLLAAGLGTAVIAEVLPCMVEVEEEGALLAPGCPELVPGLSLELARIKEAIAQLDAAREVLTAIINAPVPAAAPPPAGTARTT